MTVTLDNDMDSTTANSYVTAAEADAYFETRAFTDTWETLSDTEKASELIEACRTLERLYEFRGTKLVASQALSFPRSWGARDPLRPYTYPDILEDDQGIPVVVKNAQCELVMARRADVDSSGDVTANFSKVSIAGALSVEYASPKTSRTRETAADGTLEAVAAILRTVLAAGSGPSSFQVRKGW